jgi:hypothetical protein
MFSLSTVRRAGLASALLVVAGLTGGLPSASADVSNDFLPSGAEASAIAEVRSYLASHPRPVPPAPHATADVRAAHEAAESAFIREFPFEAGFAQWGCRAREVGTLEIENRPAGWLVIDCEGDEPPTFAQLTAPRMASGDADERSLICETQRGGQHCFEFSPPAPWVIGWYRWLGLGTIYGSFGLGRSSLPAPQCDVGEVSSLWPVGPVESGQRLYSYWQPPLGAFNISNVFYEGDEQGNRGGIRSLMCAFGPAAQQEDSGR